MACKAGQPYRKQGAGGCGWNSVPGRVTTEIGRNNPSWGGSPKPASMVMATRLAAMVEGSGQFTGPPCSGGELEKSMRTSEPATSMAISNGTGSVSTPLLSISPRAT